VTPLQGSPRPATVALFDPELDLAVLRAPDVRIPGLAPADARPGTVGAVIGFPGGGPQQITPAQVQQRFTATGRDIFNEDLVNRDVLSVSASVRPGNSGGPVVDQNGRYVGAIFASSISNPSHAYALAADEIVSEVEQAARNQAAIDTRRFACVG
jgi:S1-C subfamily serine protease